MLHPTNFNCLCPTSFNMLIGIKVRVIKKILPLSKGRSRSNLAHRMQRKANTVRFASLKNAK